MKKVEAIIRPERVHAVTAALEEKGFLGLTITEVKGRGRQKGIKLQWRAGEYQVDILPKVKVEVVVKASKADEVIDTIVEAAATGKVGDGMIFLCPVEDLVRVRTRERGKEAL
ncbi:MAG: P-II family nitrogen regulator [Gammaproteobacteria bacterium]|nr:MAG: P-II family nitrogen regulator [Gammaproteobacteria bacterium]